VAGQGECVVKPLPALRGAFRTATAATILDAGDVALVLDVPALVARLPAPASRCPPSTHPFESRLPPPGPATRAR
jgi:two-component system chemotaxis sensor kinase CheA